MKKNRFFHHRRNGFTLIELMISVSVLSLLTVFAGRVYLNYLNTSRDLKAANLIYEEARFLMEKLVREVRQNAIDYEQYFNQNVMIPLSGGVAGIGGFTDNYCSYSSFFYDSGPDGDPATLEDNESRGGRNFEREAIISGAGISPLAVRPIEHQLYLINLGGTERTALTRVTKTVNGQEIGKVAMLEMTGVDFGLDHLDGRNPTNNTPPIPDPNCDPDEGENDGLIDSWHCSADFPCITDTLTASHIPNCEGYTHTAINDPANPDHSFIDISPNALDVLDLKFLIAPQDDPWKAYNIKEVQFQPHVTIQLTVAANPKVVSSATAKPPTITLTSTVTSRNYDEVKSDCR